MRLLQDCHPREMVKEHSTIDLRDTKMGTKDFVKKHPSIIGITIGLIILAYIAFTILSKQLSH